VRAAGDKIGGGRRGCGRLGIRLGVGPLGQKGVVAGLGWG
jgi:hypothetical protein